MTAPPSVRPSVWKIGGSVLEPSPQPALLAAIVAQAEAGEPLVVVHGGGKTLTALMAQLGVAAEFRRGLRVTTPPALRAAVLALAGEVNTQLVAALNRVAPAGRFRAVGLSGVDGLCLPAEALQPELGAVGTPAGGEARLLETLLAAGFTPVLAPIAPGRDGLLNVNADLFAAHCAGLLRARRLRFVTDVAGVYDAAGTSLPRLHLEELETMEKQGAVGGGMLPKLDACRAALAAGVSEVEIVGGTPLRGTRVVAA